MERNHLLQLAAALVLSLGPVAASADIMFSGSWSPAAQSGTIAPGVTFTYSVDVDGFTGRRTFSWGVPGFNRGFAQWPAGDGFIDFHISFTLPAGVDIAATSLFGANCQEFQTSTRFCVEPFTLANPPWTPVLTGPDSISFFASAEQSLDTGDLFFVNIFFTGDAPSGSFTGSWTTSGIAEPGTLSLIGFTLLGFAAARRARIT